MHSKIGASHTRSSSPQTIVDQIPDLVPAMKSKDAYPNHNFCKTQHWSGDLTEIPFEFNFLTLAAVKVGLGRGVKGVFLSGTSERRASVHWLHRRFDCHDNG